VTDLDSASSVPEEPSQPGAVAETPQASPAATTSTGSNVTFDFAFGGNTYTTQIYAPDPTTGQYGFTITQGTTTIASLIYKDEADWAITVGLPSALKVDENLTINAMNVNITHGAITPITTTTTTTTTT
jgi:hypothetical protein